MNPSLQEQLNEPSIFVQLALMSHSCVPVAHSSTSRMDRMIIYKFFSVYCLPEQMSPSNPGGHTQTKLPLVFTHMPVDPQMRNNEVTHSSISRE